MKRIFRNLCVVILVLCLLVSGASALTVEQALDLLGQGYVRNIPTAAYEAESLEELFELLGDPYTYYMTEEEYRAFLDTVENTVSLVGIGVAIQYTEEGVLITGLLPGGSAMEAGLREGDLIVAVDGVSCVPANENHQAMIVGEEGTQVSVSVLREGVIRDYLLTRVAITVPNTEAALMNENTGLITCTSFGLETGTLFRQSVEMYRDTVDRWLVDLRGNIGGYTQAMVDAFGVFAGQGMHMFLQDRQGGVYFLGCPSEADTDRPLIVLVDGGSASAAEAFAAGVRDLDLGVVIGSRTYGKGVAQVVYDKTIFPEYFEEDGLKLTAYRFYSAGGTTNDGMGVTPTLLVSDEAAPVLAEALCPVAGTEREDLLVFTVDGQRVTADLRGLSDEVVTELLSALPPGTGIWLCDDGVEYDVTLAEGAAILGFDYGQRWFRDVSDSAFARELNTLATYRVLRGDEEGNFLPGGELKRGELCAMLAEALNLSGGVHQAFEDVPADHPLAPAINAMAEMGFVQGRGDGRFYPDQSLTQEEYFTVLTRVACYLNFYFRFEEEELTQEQLERAAASGFSYWACRSGALMEKMGVLRACVGEARPGAAVLREEAGAGLYKLLAAAGILP